eukprot:RCo018712
MLYSICSALPPEAACSSMWPPQTAPATLPYPQCSYFPPSASGSPFDFPPSHPQPQLSHLHLSASPLPDPSTNCTPLLAKARFYATACTPEHSMGRSAFPSVGSSGGPSHLRESPAVTGLPPGLVPPPVSAVVYPGTRMRARSVSAIGGRESRAPSQPPPPTVPIVWSSSNWHESSRSPAPPVTPAPPPTISRPPAVAANPSNTSNLSSVPGTPNSARRFSVELSPAPTLHRNLQYFPSHTPREASRHSTAGTPVSSRPPSSASAAPPPARAHG